MGDGVWADMALDVTPWGLRPLLGLSPHGGNQFSCAP